MVLYRPVGQREYELIEALGFRAFPPRLPEQPIFYPVLNRQYAEEIAVRWNLQDKNSGFRGYVLRFAVDDAFLAAYQVQTVGAAHHQEYWIPAGELEALNRHIQGEIEVVAAFSGEEEQPV